MDTWVWIVIGVGAALIVLALIATLMSQRRRTGLRDRFGPEYARTLERTNSRRRAEADLKERTKQREQLDVRPLSREDHDRFATQWHDVQSRFVDRPQLAVAEADELICVVMRTRGYPVDDFASQAALVSVDHPKVVENYRSAHDVSERNAHGQASTEDLRRAFVSYRSLFEELLEDGVNGQTDLRIDESDADRHADQR